MGFYEIVNPETGETIDPTRVRSLQDRLDELDPWKPEHLEGDLLKRLGVAHRKQERTLFKDEAKFADRPWEPLEEEYAEFKRSQVGKKKILVWDGTLRRDLTSEASNKYIQRLVDVGESKVFEFSTQNRLGFIHTELGVRRRLDKFPRGRPRRKPRKDRSPRRPRPAKGSRAKPTFDGLYWFVKRDVVQKTAAQEKAFREIVRDYFDRRYFRLLRQGFGIQDDTSTGAAA